MEQFEELNDTLFQRIKQEELVLIRGGVSEANVRTITTIGHEVSDYANDPGN
ncbi:hypothetical protein [Mucilaginibacter lappiensis]|jgi:hypothetical protein|uniref:hypothetical protein n=1 Tax=Mucilaginibacter lappiensis TaxID=354630 RepID=UPI003D20118C